MSKSLSIITVTLNTAVDRVLEADNFTVGKHAKARQINRYPAGKGINVSRTLARLGWMNVATGYAGEQHAEEYERYLKTVGPGSVKNQLLTVKGATRENITIVDPKNNTDTHIRTEGYTISPHALGRITSKVGLLARPDTIIVFSGSLPTGMELADFYTLVNVAMSAGSRVILDVDGQTLRSILHTDTINIDDTPQPNPSSKICYLVKPNLEELAEMIGVPAILSHDEILKAARLLATRVEWVVVTLGGDGAIMIDPEGNAWQGKIDIPKDQIVNTVGCGDTMVAGLIDGQLRELPPDQILKSALALATTNATHVGVADYELAQVEPIEEKVAVTSIDN
ncbi:1-phosphofructokinase family hexose kinase [Planctomycetota bacterium]|nr:1-phosphofructokinase family hexose kinase [Planctomycetota bacterium]